MAFTESSLMKMLDNDIRSLAKLIHEHYPIVPEDEVVSLWWNMVQGAPDIVKNVKAPNVVDEPRPSAPMVDEPQPGPSAPPMVNHDDDEHMEQLLANLNEDELINGTDEPGPSRPMANHDFDDDDMDQLLANLNEDELVNGLGSITINDVQDDELDAQDDEEVPTTVKAKAKAKKAPKAVAAVSLCKYKYTKKGPKQGQECGSRVKNGGNFCGKHKKHNTVDE